VAGGGAVALAGASSPGLAAPDGAIALDVAIALG
jgi:hypothetical protein